MSKKILLALPSLNFSNGVTALYLSYFKHINLEKFKIEILAHESRKDNSSDFFKNRGIKVHIIEKNQSFFSKIKFIKEIIKVGQYDVVHCNMLNFGFFVMKYAKKYKVKTRILHSHQTKSSERIIPKLIYLLVLPIMKSNANKFLACSKMAGDFMFRNKDYDILQNSVDFEQFKFSKENRDIIRKNYNIYDDSRVYGFVGRFVKQKNINYLIDFAKYLRDHQINGKIMLIGTGKMKSEVKDRIVLEKLNNILLLGEVSDTQKYYSAFDVFILPSLFEGLPIVGIEAQAVGIPCLFSTNITRELKFRSNVQFFELDGDFDRLNSLASTLLNMANDFLTNSAVFDTKNVAHKLEKIYNEEKK